MIVQLASGLVVSASRRSLVIHYACMRLWINERSPLIINIQRGTCAVASLGGHTRPPAALIMSQSKAILFVALDGYI